ncbi:hypothetical protein HZC31_04255 [Candidatus Woesearchaeota archaeon]|nr:hypothetical protein [Candidatus Woesearchaeota archaeon]
MTRTVRNIGLLVVAMVGISSASLAAYEIAETIRIHERYPEISEINKLERIRERRAYQNRVAQGNAELYASIEGKLKELHPEQAEIREAREELDYHTDRGVLALMFALFGPFITLLSIKEYENAYRRREKTVNY